MLVKDTFLFKKEVDWSTLHEGISVPVTFQMEIIKYIGNLPKGKYKAITIIIDGLPFEARIVNQKFDETKYVGHKDIIQVRYGKSSALAAKLRQVFSSTYRVLELSRALPKAKQLTTQNPLIAPEYIGIYLSPSTNTVLFDCFVENEHNILKSEVAKISETRFEYIINENDDSATIDSLLALKKIRKLNASIASTLKSLYLNRCQICGCSFYHRYGADIAEAHHIKPFTISLDNNPQNIIILCANHHSVIHKANPSFDRAQLRFIYPSGAIDKISIDKHLKIS